MPKYNELKHFNPAKIAAVFIEVIASQQSAGKGDTGRLGKLIAANGVSGNPSNTMTFY